MRASRQRQAPGTAPVLPIGNAWQHARYPDWGIAPAARVRNAPFSGRKSWAGLDSAMRVMESFFRWLLEIPFPRKVRTLLLDLYERFFV